MRTNASRTAGSSTASETRSPPPAGIGRRSLSIPQARPPGTPTTRATPSRSNEPRGVVRWKRGSSSAAARAANAKHRRIAMAPDSTLDTPGPYAVAGVVSVLISCGAVVISCEGCRHFVCGEAAGGLRGRSPLNLGRSTPSTSVELHEPGADLVWLEADAHDGAVDVGRGRGPDHREPRVPQC